MTGALGQIRTVIGDLAPSKLGRTDYHEHLFQVSPLLPGDELDDEVASGVEAQSLRSAGIDATIEATPLGLGRNPGAVARISAGTGLTIIHTTGAHRGDHYPDDHWLRRCDVDQLTAIFAADLLDGMTDSCGEESGERDHDHLTVGPTGEPVRAGLIKAGIGYWSISAFEYRVLEAVAAAHQVSGAAVMVHLESGSAAYEVLEVLNGLGVRPDRVVLAHLDRNPDPGLHTELAQAGAYLGYDGMARHREWPDSMLIDLIHAVAAAGGAERILIGGDVARRSRYRAYGGMPGLDYLPKRFLPRLAALGQPDLLSTIVEANPARLLTWTATHQEEL